MKSFLLAAILSFSASGVVLAQENSLPPDYRWEIALNGGGSFNTTLMNVPKLYQGTKGSFAGTGDVKLNYNIFEKWQLGLEVGATKWTTTGNWQLTDVYGQSLGSRKVTFDIANPAVGVTVHANRVVPFYSKYTHYNKSNFYYGINAGIISTVNDGRSYNSAYSQNPDPTLMYTSRYDYAYGIGYTGGLQVGYEYYFIPGLGVNVEAAGRYADIGTNDTRQAHENTRYGILYFPCTIGIRFRF